MRQCVILMVFIDGLKCESNALGQDMTSCHDGNVQQHRFLSTSAVWKWWRDVNSTILYHLLSVIAKRLATRYTVTTFRQKISLCHCKLYQNIFGHRLSYIYKIDDALSRSPN